MVEVAVPPKSQRMSLPIPSRLVASPASQAAVPPKNQRMSLPIPSRLVAPPASQASSTVVVLSQVAGRPTALQKTCRYSSSRPLERDYVVEGEVLGCGMSGAVHLAIGRGDGRKYAVKTFAKAGMSTGQLAELKSEAEIYLSLDHPHIARLENVYETSAQMHLVMEHMAGGELFDRLRTQHRFAEEDAAGALHQMLLAVAYLHSHRIAHRDLKLENFMYEHPDMSRLKMIDFGLAQSVEQSALMTKSCGSLYYIAPEVLARSYTQKADMWSLGIIACMLLTGAAPFAGDDDEVLDKIRYGDIDWPCGYQGLSALAADFLGGLLVVDPARRMSAQEALSHPWVQGCWQDASTLCMRTLLSLRRFCRASKFQRNVLSAIAWSLSTGELAELCGQFWSVDKDRCGTISLLELKEALVGIGSAEAEEMFAILDADRSDEVDYSEFMAALLPSTVRVQESALRRAFGRFDADGDGQIDCDELRCALGDCEDVECAMREADSSGDGKLDYDEFSAFVRSWEPDSCAGAELLLAPAMVMSC